MSKNSSLDMYYDINNSDDSRVVEWLNTAAISTSTSDKLDLLRKVQEVLLHKSPELLLGLLPDILSLTSDRDAEVKKWLVGFIEVACKNNEAVFEFVLPNLHMLLCDESIQVQKRVIQAASSIYRNMLVWLAKVPQVTDVMEQAWNRFSNIKVEILNMVDSDNDGIRTHSVKFLEGVVLIQTYPEPGLPRKDNDFSLEDIPLTLKFARRRKLEEEANHIFTLLVKFHGSPHISSVNLMACMGALCTIAKARPEFMQRVVLALEVLNSNLPPTLTPSQVSSVRKHIKLQLMNVLKHPSSFEVQPTLISILTELGATSQELTRAIPKIDEALRRKLSKRLTDSLSNIPTKRQRMDILDVEMEQEQLPKQKLDAFKINEAFILEKLNTETVTQIVIASMHNLPKTMPAHFNSNYTPIANPGTSGQLRNLALLLGKQFTEAGVGPGNPSPQDSARSRLNIVDTGVTTLPTKEDTQTMQEDAKKPVKLKEVEKQARKPRVKALRFDQITKPLTFEVRKNMMVKSVKRILRSEQSVARDGAEVLRKKIITTLACTFGEAVRDEVLAFILEDMKAQMDMALAWLYEEYSFMQGFNRMTNVLRREAKPDHSYNSLLCALISHLEFDNHDRDAMLGRLFLEAPLITEEAVELLKHICVQENRAATAMTLLYELVFRRPTKYLTFVNVLLHHTAHENSLVRDEATKRVIKLYEREDMQNIIEEQAIVYVEFLTQSQPPPILFGADRGRPKVLDNWNEEACKASLYLYLALLPIKETLIHELSRVYTQTTPDIKRTILRLLEQPVRGMGMDSPQLLTLVESCPKGAETLVTRIIHILTDRGPPSAILVSKVRELYQARVSDVRFLIPVLNGLTKKEIIAALPKLIKLNPVVVKEVFSRLLAGHSSGPITPAELLIALHTIEASKADIKTVMKATSLCFAEKNIYTQEILAVVMQQLMEVTPLPTLLMRTVIQSLSLYPRLSGFVMNILQRLILKQVWKQKIVWEGFIKCCQRTKPQSFQVLLQLPSAQLSEALVMCPDLRNLLLEHVKSFSETQRAHLPSAVMDVLMGISQDADIKLKSESTPELIASEPLPPGMD